MVGMTANHSSINEQKRNGTAGRFGAKSTSAPSDGLSVPARPYVPPQNPLWDARRDYPISADVRAVVSRANTYREVEDLYEEIKQTAGHAYYEASWAVTARGSELREAGVPGVPSSLPESSIFRDAQSYAELDAMWEDEFEEPRSDMFLGKARQDHMDRRIELIHARAHDITDPQ